MFASKTDKTLEAVRKYDHERFAWLFRMLSIKVLPN